MKRISGIKLLDEREGEGRSAQKGDRVVYNIRIFLNQGDEVLLNDIQSKQLPKEMMRVEDRITFIDHSIVLGKPQAIVGVEHALLGVKVGGYRKVRVGPHLVYRGQGRAGPDSSRCSVDLRDLAAPNCGIVLRPNL